MMTLFAQMGFESVFFARIDYQDYALRSSQKRLEWMWQPSRSLGNSSQIFTRERLCDCVLPLMAVVVTLCNHARRHVSRHILPARHV